MDNTPFQVKDCSLLPIALGLKAQTLIELRDRIAIVPVSSLYTHFWSGRLRRVFEFTEYHNDFSIWAYSCLYDDVLAERLDIINPNDFDDLEGLRSELLTQIENRLDEQQIVPMARGDRQFHFARSNIVVFDTHVSLQDPVDLLRILPNLPLSSLFYHVIDATLRTPGKMQDFCIWMQAFSPKYDGLIEQCTKIDPYFISLSDLRLSLIKILSDHYG